jgi:hypothetical protein
LLTADDQTLDALLKTKNSIPNYDFGYAWTPTTYYLGYAEGDALGVKVFFEHVIAYPRLFISSTLRETFTNLTNQSNYYLKFPTELTSDAQEVGLGFFRINLTKTLGIYYNSNYFVWAPGTFVFKTLVFLEDEVFQNIFITVLLFMQFLWALASYFNGKFWVGVDAKLVIILSTLTFVFIVFSNTVFLFRSDKELIVVMPIMAILMGNALILDFNLIKRFLLRRSSSEQK